MTKKLLISLNFDTVKKINLDFMEAKVPTIEEYVRKLQANFNIRLAAQNSE